MPSYRVQNPETGEIRTEWMTARQRGRRALALRDQGNSLRVIAEMLGWDPEHTGAVSRAIRQARIYRGETVAPVARRSNRIDASRPRRFGIEIEFVCRGVSQERISQALNAAGVRTSVERYNHSTRSHWKLITDASCGLELVSPPLHSDDEGYAQVTTAMRVLRELGAEVNTQCGMHVHVDMAGLTGDQIATVIETYAAHQDTIDRFVAPSRRGGAPGATNCTSYTNRLSANVVANLAEGFRRNRAAGYANRYSHVNVQSFPAYGTLEFRQHQGSLNGTKATTWVRFLQALVASVVAGTQRQVMSGTGMPGSLVDAGGMSQRAATYLMSRMSSVGAR